MHITITSKDIVATPNQGLALRFVVSAVIRGTRDIKYFFGRDFQTVEICASNYDSTLNRYAFIFSGEIIFFFSLSACLSLAVVRLKPVVLLGILNLFSNVVREATK